MVHVVLFFAALILNLGYEMLHSLLYKTCWQASLRFYAYLMLKGAVFDGFAITLIYAIVSFIAQSGDIISSPIATLLFMLLTLGLAYVWEILALKKNRWEYGPYMPRALGVGLTPLVQLSLTGFYSLYIIFGFY